jgi:hypothetical protein
MPLTRGQITIGSITLEVEPFEWPRNLWEVLELHATRTTGWQYLTATVVAALNVMFNGAHGDAVEGLSGQLVQYLTTTGSAAFTVTDWRGNTGSFVWKPNDGFVPVEIQGAAEANPLGGGFWTATLRLIQVA